MSYYDTIRTRRRERLSQFPLLLLWTDICMLFLLFQQLIIKSFSGPLSRINSHSIVIIVLQSFHNNREYKAQIINNHYLLCFSYSTTKKKNSIKIKSTFFSSFCPKTFAMKSSHAVINLTISVPPLYLCVSSYPLFFSL